jgi:hypothetical protein
MMVLMFKMGMMGMKIDFSESTMTKICICRFSFAQAKTRDGFHHGIFSRPPLQKRKIEVFTNGKTIIGNRQSNILLKIDDFGGECAEFGTDPAKK